jgi:predicted Zn-dependent protease
VNEPLPQLEPADRARLDAVVGWIGLGDLAEAESELKKTEARFPRHPCVMQVRWRLHWETEDWEACLEIARALTVLAPDRRFGWLHYAVSLHKLNRTSEARDVILSVLNNFECNTTFPYYLALFSARLGELDEARSWLEKALACAKDKTESDRLKTRAMTEPDLQQLWDVIGQI